VSGLILSGFLKHVQWWRNWISRQVRIALPLDPNLVVEADACSRDPVYSIINNRSDTTRYSGYYCHIEIIVPDNILLPEVNTTASFPFSTKLAQRRNKLAHFYLIREASRSHLNAHFRLHRWTFSNAINHNALNQQKFALALWTRTVKNSDLILALIRCEWAGLWLVQGLTI
jgi:hypothetical protein